MEQFSAHVPEQPEPTPPQAQDLAARETQSNPVHAPLSLQGSSDYEMQGNPHLLLPGPRDSPVGATLSNPAHTSLWATEESCKGDPEQADVLSQGP